MEINKNLDDRERIDKNLEDKVKINKNLNGTYKDSLASSFVVDILMKTDEDIERAKDEIYNFVRENLRYPTTDSSNSEENLLAYNLIALREMKQSLEKEIQKSNGNTRLDKYNLFDFFADLDYVISTKGNSKSDKQIGTSNYSSEEIKILEEIKKYKSYIEGKNIGCLKSSFREFLENGINIELDKEQIHKYVKENFNYPQKNSKDLEERLLAYKCEFLQKIKSELLEKRRKSNLFINDSFWLIDFFSELDYIVSKKETERSNNLESISQHDKIKTASEILSENKKLVLEILSLRKEVKELNLKINDNNEKIQKLYEEYKSNEQRIEDLMSEEDKKKPKM